MKQNNKPHNIKTAEIKQAPAIPAPVSEITPTQIYPNAAPYKVNNGGLAIAGLILGILSLSTGWISFLGFGLGVTAFILSIIALKKKQNKGMSITGIVTGSIAIVWNIFVTIFFIIALFGFIFAAAVSEGSTNHNRTNIRDTVLKYSSGSGSTSGQITASGSSVRFKKGETAIFDKFKIKVNSIQRNYTASGSSSFKPDAGKELILINLDITNNTDQATSFYISNLKISDDGEESMYHYGIVTLENRIKTESYIPRETKTGQIIYQVTKDSTKLKLYQETTSYNIAHIQSKIIYTLDLY